MSPENKERRARRREEAKELVAEGLLLPAEAEVYSFGEEWWMGDIRYEKSSGLFVIKHEEDGTWGQVSETTARKYLRDFHGVGNATLREIKAKIKDGDLRVPLETLDQLNGNSPSAAINRINSLELDQTIAQIRQEFAVDRCGPLAGFEAGRIFDQNGEIFLVTKGPTLIEPKEGEFPTIKKLFDGLLPVPDEKMYCFTWLKDAVEALRSDGERKTGKLLALVGPKNCGKSFVQDHIFTPMLGGRMGKPYMFMCGETTFNTLSEVEHWKIADQGSTTPKGRATFAINIKQFVADEDVTDHAKGKNLRSAKAFRRISLSCNEEPKYLNIIPPIDPSLEDKIIILRAFKGGIPEDYGDPKTQKAYREKIADELPAFLHYLLHQTIDPKYKGRFGVADYRNPEIMRMLEGIKLQAPALDLIDTAFEEPGRVEGTAGMLLAKASSRMKKLCRGSSKVFGRYLSRWVKELPDRAKVRVLDGNKIYTITPAAA
jgi:hypothetical protein